MVDLACLPLIPFAASPDANCLAPLLLLANLHERGVAHMIAAIQSLTSHHWAPEILKTAMRHMSK